MNKSHLAESTRSACLQIFIFASALLIGADATYAGPFDFFTGESSTVKPTITSRPRPTPRPNPNPWWPPGYDDDIDDNGNSWQPRPPIKEASPNDWQKQSETAAPFYVTRDRWTPSDEIQFGKFVNQMGRAIAARKCSTVRDCFRSPEANMYAYEDPPGAIFYSDCADFPYLLRAYFAFHNGLPFSHVTQVTMNKTPVASANDKDTELPEKRLDNSPYGNSIVARGNVNVPRDGYRQPPGIFGYLKRLYNTVATSTFRVSPLTANYRASDVYPVRINRDGIGPGTLVHSTGHLMVVWDVDARGTIRVIDAHPDGSISHKTVQPSTLERTRPDQGLGFFRFRPLYLIGAAQDWSGNYYGGKIIGESDENLYRSGLYSLEQWFGPGTDLPPGTKVDPNLWKTVYKRPGFFDYLASQMRKPNAQVSADEVISEMLESLCSQFQMRMEDVAAAVKNGTHKLPHPESLPADIFGQSEPAVWGPYSSPGRDGRLRAAVGDIVKAAVNQFRMAKSGQQTGLVFKGSAEEYVKALRDRLSKTNRSCSVSYTNSSGKTVKLSLNQVMSRLNLMSFDPYHCPEKRWGASGTEFKSCSDTDPEHRWYKAQAFMRNTVGKMDANEAYVIRSNTPITLEMLADETLIDQPSSAPINLGTKYPPVMDLDAAFGSARFLEELTK